MSFTLKTGRVLYNFYPPATAILGGVLPGIPGASWKSHTEPEVHWDVRDFDGDPDDLSLKTTPLTPEERVEVAEAMCAQWLHWARTGES